MEPSRLKNLRLLVLVFIFLFFPNICLAWGTNITHPGIVDLAVDRYNQVYDPDITETQREYLKQGAIAEDTPTRWMNHFYDPVFDVGLKNLWSSAKDWSTDAQKQRDYALGDKSWYRALLNWQENKKDQSLEELGHTLHLIADMSVPAHTRDDIHIIGDSLEQFASLNWDYVVDNLEETRVLEVDSLEKIFNSSAVYSNNNFFSDDTVLSDKYKEPSKDNLKTDFISYNDNLYKYFFVNNIKICRNENVVRWQDVLKNNKDLSECKVNKTEVLQDLSTHLTAKAVSDTVSALHLFFEEVKKDQDFDLPNSQGASFLGNINYSFGRIITGAKNVYDRFVKDKITSQEVMADESGGSVGNAELPDGVPLDNGVVEEVKVGLPVLTTKKVLPIEQLKPMVVVENEKEDIFGEVINIVDGDTFDVKFGDEVIRIRPIGIDTPEIFKKKIQCYGMEAKEKAGDLLLNKKVRLEKDSIVADLDIYGRSLRYVFLEDGLFFNEYMVQNGYAKEYDFKGLGYDYKDRFVGLEDVAKAKKLGLWNKSYCDGVVIDPSPPLSADQDDSGGVGDDDGDTGGSGDTGGGSTGGSSGGGSTGGGGTGGGDGSATTTPTSTPPNITPTSTPTSTLNLPQISLDSQFDNIIYTTSSTSTIFGSCSTNTVKIFVYFTTSSDGVNLNLSNELFREVIDVDFVNEVNLLPGNNYFYVSSADAEGATSTLVGLAYFVLDNEAPPTPTVEIVNNSGFGSANLTVNILGEDALSPSYYDLYYSTSTIQWLTFVTSSPQNSFEFLGDRGQSYYFKSRIIDELGNVSDWSAQTSSTVAVINSSQEVVINEIAWAGTSVWRSSDEWFELYNNTGEDIDLSGWKIKVGNRFVSNKKINNNIIPANGYLLFERTDDKTVNGLTADIIFTLSGGFNNSGEVMQLFDGEGRLVDEVNCLAGWFAGNANFDSYRSMERINPVLSGNDLNNWQNNEGARLQAIPDGGGILSGSPKDNNTIGPIFLSSRQDEVVRILNKNYSPYILGFYEIPVGKKLIIEDGVVVKSRYTGSIIEVLGELEINGDEDGVILTAGSDTDLEGDAFSQVYGDYIDAPVSEDWMGIRFENASGTLSGVDMRYAGHQYYFGGMYNGNAWNGIRIENSNVSILNSKIKSSGREFVYTEGSTTTVDGVDFKDGVMALNSKNSELNLLNSTFDNFTSSEGVVYVMDKFPSVDNLSFSSSTMGYLVLRAVFMDEDGELKPNIPYLLDTLLINEGVKLKILSGADVAMEHYSDIVVDGVLEVDGEAGNEVNIYGFNTNTYWGSIYFNTSTSYIRNAILERGHLHMSMPSEKQGVLIVNNSNLELQNVDLLDLRPPGNFIRSRNSVLNVQNVSFVDDEKFTESLSGLAYTSGVNVIGGSISLDSCNFANLNYGVRDFSVPTSTPLTMNNMNADSFVNVDTDIEVFGWGGW